MKQRLPFLFVLAFILWAFPAFAEESAPPSASVYNISDVAVDVTADSAAKARDQAIAQAQRNAFGQLLERLGADASVGTKLSDDDLSTLVQNFEVRNEKASAIRYIGTFAVQFRPTAVRNFLGSKSAKFDDSRGKPVIVLPIVKDGKSTILWEEPTRWQKLWIDASRDGSIVPLIVPTGTPEDKAILSTVDALVGKVEPIKSLIDKYKADAAVVAILNGSPDDPSAGYIIDAQHFGALYDDGSDVEHISLNGNPNKNAVDSILNEGIKQIRHKIEKEGKQEQKQTDSPSTSETTPPPMPAQQPIQQTWSDEVPPSRMTVSVQFSTLAQWSDIQRRMLASTGVRRIDISSVERGEATLELGFAGKLEDVQMALAQHGLRLTQDVLSGQWMLKGL